MYCGECGAKLKNGANFCGECGNKVSKPNKTIKAKKEVKPLNKKTKIILGVLGVIIISFIIGFNILGKSLGVEAVSKKYMDALKTSDSDSLYDTLSISGDNTFTSKEAFSKIYNQDNNDLQGINSISLQSITYSSDKKSADAKYKVIKDDKEINITVHLTKDDKKKYLFFDNWNVSNDILDMLDITIVNNYTISVPKNSTVKIDDKEVSKNYINSEEKTDSMDVYVIPKIFASTYNISVVLPNNMTINTEKKISYYYDSYTFDLNLNDLNDESKEELQEKSTEVLKNIYSNLIDKKTFNDYQKNNKTINDNMKDTYNDLYAKLITDSSYTLLKFDITDSSITGVRILKDGRLGVTLKYNYTYTVMYKNGDKKEQKDGKSNQISTITYDIQDGDYQLYDLTSPVKFFSIW